VVQETRGFDEVKGVTFSQRKKEEAHDYRYFPEPDLPVYRTADFDIEKLRTFIPELPHAKRDRFKKEYGLSEEQAEVLVFDRNIAKFFEEAGSELKEEDKNVLYQTLYNYLVSDLLGMMKAQNVSFTDLKVTPESFVDLVVLVQKGTIGSRVAKDVLLWMFETGGDPKVKIAEDGLAQVSDEGALLMTVQAVIGANDDAVNEYRKGKEAILKFLVGQAMKELKGKGNPQVLEGLLKKEMGKATDIS